MFDCFKLKKQICDFFSSCFDSIIKKKTRVYYYDLDDFVMMNSSNENVQKQDYEENHDKSFESQNGLSSKKKRKKKQVLLDSIKSINEEDKYFYKNKTKKVYTVPKKK